MLLKAQKEVKGDQWEVIEFPAILDDKPVWPEYWNIEELEKVKATLPVKKWNAQFMQKPTSEEGAIIKRDWWRLWKHDWIPQLEYVIQSYDTAFFKKRKRLIFRLLQLGDFFIRVLMNLLILFYLMPLKIAMNFLN